MTHTNNTLNTLDLNFIKVIKSISACQTRINDIQDQAENIPAEINIPNDNGLFAGGVISISYGISENLNNAMQAIDENLKHSNEIKDILDNEVTLYLSNAYGLCKGLYLLVKNFYNQINILQNETAIADLLRALRELYDIELADAFQ